MKLVKTHKTNFLSHGSFSFMIVDFRCGFGPTPMCYTLLTEKLISLTMKKQLEKPNYGFSHQIPFHVC